MIYVTHKEKQRVSNYKGTCKKLNQVNNLNKYVEIIYDRNKGNANMSINVNLKRFNNLSLQSTHLEYYRLENKLHIIIDNVITTAQPQGCLP